MNETRIKYTAEELEAEKERLLHSLLRVRTAYCLLASRVGEATGAEGISTFMRNAYLKLDTKKNRLCK